MSRKYRPLEQYLLALPDSTTECTLSFTDIANSLGLPLPMSAFGYKAWWANQSDVESRPQAKAWIAAGFGVDAVKLGKDGWVRFKRSHGQTPLLQAENASSAPPPAVNPAPDTDHVLTRAKSVQEVNYDTSAVFLVSCVATKLHKACAARELYASNWFKKARNHVEQAHLPWFILSAKHGLVHPDQQIDPYELTLNTMPVRARKAWAEKVFDQIKHTLPVTEQFIILAGMRYREFLQPLLEVNGAKVVVPMVGLTQGRQLEWFDTHQHHVQAE